MNAFTQPLKPKFHKGQFVFTTAYPKMRREIRRIDLSIDPRVPHRYKVLGFDQRGVPLYSKWLTEQEISTRKIKSQS